MMAASVGVGEARMSSGIAEQEFELLVELHQRSIYRLLLGLTHDPDAAETLTQECFLKAFQNRMKFRGESTVKTWLTRIAINLAYDHRRNRRAQFWKKLFNRNHEGSAAAQTNDVAASAAQSLLETLADNHTSAEHQLLAREQLSTVWAAVERLPNQQRTVFLLRFIEEMSLEEIAQAIGVRVASVKTHLRRATLAVRQAVASPMWGEA
jgi:RNA polymerase sigma-70 factor, ECF subfamily